MLSGIFYVPSFDTDWGNYSSERVLCSCQTHSKARTWQSEPQRT